MSLLLTKHNATALHADIGFYGGSMLALSTWLALRAPVDSAAGLLVWMLAGLLLWSALEYSLHRWVLHGLAPFKWWHLEHHRRPAALIRTATWFSATLMVILVWLPGVWLLGQWPGSALTLGVLIGYLVYSVTHHAMHHGSTDNRWLQERKYWHARHHHTRQPCCYGVTTGLWDRFLRTTSKRQQARVKIPVRRVNG